MAIASSCYIRTISKSDQILLEKASKIFNINTTPSIFKHILKDYFEQTKIIENREKQIEKLNIELDIVKEQLDNFKNDFSLFLELEKRKDTQLKLLKKSL